MVQKKLDTQKLRQGLKRIRISLIVLTIVEFLYFTTIFSKGILWVENNSQDAGEITIWILSFIASGFIIWIFHLTVLSTIIWYNWKKMPINRKKKKDNTLMVFFLGIIGMWLWVPDKKELRELVQEKTHNIV